MALIEYLQKHGNDNERLQMVALNFNMFRELAMTTEERAKVELASIKSNHLGIVCMCVINIHSCSHSGT